MSHTRMLVVLGGLGIVLAMTGLACAHITGPLTRQDKASPVPSPTGTADAPDLTVIVSTQGSLGPILADARGRTLYVFFGDQPDFSMCSGSCAEKWPPLTVEDEAAVASGEGVKVKLDAFPRDDGTLQVAANHMPLYHWAGDSAPGDAGGEGVAGMWYALRPNGKLATVPTPTALP